MRWCESAATHLHERAQQVLGRNNEAQSGRGQVRLRIQRRRAATLLVMRLHKTIGLAGCPNWQGKSRISSGSFPDTLIKPVAWAWCHGMWCTCGKIRQSGSAMLHGGRWEIVRHCRLPSVEQVCRLAADLREEARQAHENDRENRMTTWQHWFRTAYKAACNWCKGVDNETHTQPTTRKCTRSLRKLGCLHEVGTQPTWEQFEASFREHILATCECTVNELNADKFKKCVQKFKTRVLQERVGGGLRNFKHCRCVV